MNSSEGQFDIQEVYDQKSATLIGSRGITYIILATIDPVRMVWVTNIIQPQIIVTFRVRSSSVFT